MIPFTERRSGVLLHPTSLPGPHGHGDLGPAAHAFVDWLAAAGQGWWQMLPVGPSGWGASPYDSPSASAGSPWLVSLELLSEAGWLTAEELAAPPELGAGRVRHVEAQAFRSQCLERAFARFRAQPSPELSRELEAFRSEQGSWLGDYCLFAALKAAQSGAAWPSWPAELARREPGALSRARQELAESVAFHEFVQFAFQRQWQSLRAHAQRQGVQLLGDVPMFVAHDGVDTWAHAEQFFLDDAGEPTVVAGVPPDPFSETGQLWGNPLYRWDLMRAQGYDWWLARLSATLQRFNALRLDHFIGFRRYWEIPRGAPDARQGRFVQVPGEDFFSRVREHLGGLPFVAEDLGIVTPEVTRLRLDFELPGMRVLEFAFGPEPNDYLPHRYEPSTVVYTGTHDNDTIVGWLSSLGTEERARVLAYTGDGAEEIHWQLMRLAATSVARLCLFPLQDVLGLGTEARMNVPGTCSGNWEFRVTREQLTPAVAERLATLTRVSERAAPGVRGDAAAFVRGGS